MRDLKVGLHFYNARLESRVTFFNVRLESCVTGFEHNIKKKGRITIHPFNYNFVEIFLVDQLNTSFYEVVQFFPL